MVAEFEQVPVDGEQTEGKQIVNANQEGGETTTEAADTKVADANLVIDKNKENQDAVTKEEELSEEEAEKFADEILESGSESLTEAQDQINQLKFLSEKYKNEELEEEQKAQYESLMSTIRTELDRDIPTVIEMNKEIDINYYNEHPDEAKNAADNIVNNYENMNDAQLVSNVVSRSEYLSQDSKQKLDTVINSVINSLNEDAKNILKKDSKEK